MEFVGFIKEHIYMTYHSGLTHQGIDNQFMPNAKHVDNLGDQTDLMTLLGQFSNTPGLSNRKYPLNYSLNKMNPVSWTYTIDNTSTGMKMLAPTSAVKLTPSIRTNLVIDDIVGDTITQQQFLHRHKLTGASATELFRNYDKTLTTVPKVRWRGIFM